MSTNPYFRNQDYPFEQRLLQDLADEMIQVNGLDVYYLPRIHVAIDELFLQDPLSRYDQAIKLEMYLKTFEGFQGDGDLMGRFGFSFADRMTLSVSKRRFQEEVGIRFGLLRPQEGDLLYFPLTKGLFEVKFIEHEAAFYQAGTLTTFELVAEKFNYNSETFDTGINEIDGIVAKSMAAEDYMIQTKSGFYLVTEGGNIVTTENYVPDRIDSIAQNDLFKTTTNEILDWSEADPFSESGHQGDNVL